MMEETNIGRKSPTAGSINVPPTFTVGSSDGEMRNVNEWFDRPDHPLLNNVVLGIIFEQLGGTELMKCRFVCKTWNVCTIPLTREKFSVTIYEDPNPENSHRIANELHTIDNFVEVFRSNNLGIPFAKFKLGSFCTTDGAGQEFLQICGSTIKKIKFLGGTHRVEDFSELLKSTPKLETLTIPKRIHSSPGNIVKLFPEDSQPILASLKNFKVLENHPQGRNDCCPTFLEELVTAAENIASVTLRYVFPILGEGDLTISCFQVLSLIEKLGREPSVQDLQITCMQEDSNYIELLHKMAAKQNGLKLKKFRYHAADSDDVSHPILKIISLFKHSLEYLEIYGKRFTSFMEFPEMKRLTHLILSFHEDFYSRHVNLNKIVPNLEVLHLNVQPEPENDEFFPESEPCPTIKSLQLHMFILKINGFNQMLTVFPNLTDFRIEIEDDGEEILRKIWTHMTQLESLTIFGCIRTTDSLDSVLTGILNLEPREIRNLIRNMNKMTTEVERREFILNLRNQHAQLPYIGNLTKLRSLTLDLTHLTDIDIGQGTYKQRKHLTDLTGYLGLYSIKTLKQLNVQQCKLTKTCCEILTKDMGLEECKTTNEFYTPGWNLGTDSGTPGMCLVR